MQVGLRTKELKYCGLTGTYNCFIEKWSKIFSWYCLIQWHVYCKACRWILIFFFQTDHIYIQSLRGILDIHESGVNETNFHEVSIQNSHMSFAYFNLMHFTHSQIHIGSSLTYNRMCDFYLNSFGFIKTKRGPFILFLPLFCLYM